MLDNLEFAKEKYGNEDYRNLRIETIQREIKTESNLSLTFHQITIVSQYASSFVILYPFSDWKDKKISFWWNACNQVKHNDMVGRREGNLENVMNAFRALGVLFHLIVGNITITRFFSDVGEYFQVTPSPFFLPRNLSNQTKAPSASH